VKIGCGWLSIRGQETGKAALSFGEGWGEMEKADDIRKRWKGTVHARGEAQITPQKREQTKKDFHRSGKVSFVL